jgi:hypothetical protein
MLEISTRRDWRCQTGQSGDGGEVRSIDDGDMELLDFAVVVSCNWKGVTIDLL